MLLYIQSQTECKGIPKNKCLLHHKGDTYTALLKIKDLKSKKKKKLIHVVN